MPTNRMSDGDRGEIVIYQPPGGAATLMEQEAEAFRRLHLDLLATIPGHYAAVYQGQLVDHDVDQLALFQRIEARFPGLPVLIRQVRPEFEQTIMVRSPRIEYE